MSWDYLPCQPSRRFWNFTPIYQGWYWQRCFSAAAITIPLHLYHHDMFTATITGDVMNKIYGKIKSSIMVLFIAHIIGRLIPVETRHCPVGFCVVRDSPCWSHCKSTASVGMCPTTSAELRKLSVAAWGQFYKTDTCSWRLGGMCRDFHN